MSSVATASWSHIPISSSSCSTRISPTCRKSPPSAAPERGESGTGLYKSLSGQQVLVSYQRIQNIGWTVLVERPLTEAYAPALVSLGRSAGILLAVGLMAVGAAVQLGRRVVKPIEISAPRRRRLKRATWTPDCICTPATSLRNWPKISTGWRRVLQEAHAGLEQKVAERTQALEQSLNEVRALGDTIQTVNASLDLQNVLQTIVVHATELSRSDGGLIYEFDENSQVFRVRAGHLLRSEFITALEADPPTLHDSIVGRAAATGEPQNVSDIATEKPLLRSTPDCWRRAIVRFLRSRQSAATSS